MELFAVLAVGIALVTLYLLARPDVEHKSVPPGADLPDGPKDKPIVGNLLDVPAFHSWFKFFDWSKQFGPLFRLNLAGRNHIIVSTEDIANDLLRERGSIYSSREQLPMAAKLLSEGLRPLFMPYGETWRNVRKLMHALTNVKVVSQYEEVQRQESVRAVGDLIRAPDRYEIWFERYSAGLILRLAYSKTVYTGQESFVRRIMKIVHNVERVASPGAYLVDTVPALMYLPTWLAPFKREGARLHADELNCFRELLQDGLKAGQGVSGSNNWCSRWYDSRDAYNISEDHVAYALGTLFEAGAGTTASAMMSFMLTMTLHPKEFQKLQEEVDKVVGADRLPDFQDFHSLPRMRAVTKEVLRWRPVTAGGLPHMLTKDDVYKMPDGRSMYLKAGSNIHPVQWSIHRDPKLYPDPESFRPERWLDQDWPTYREPLSQYPNLQNFSAFGFGRRICPGQNIAERSLYLLISRTAWACDIGLARDEAGNDIVPPAYDYVSGFNVQPKPFPFALKARSGRDQVVEAQYALAWGNART